MKTTPCSRRRRRCWTRRSCCGCYCGSCGSPGPEAPGAASVATREDVSLLASDAPSMTSLSLRPSRFRSLIAHYSLASVTSFISSVIGSLFDSGWLSCHRIISFNQFTGLINRSLSSTNQRLINVITHSTNFP